MQDVSAAGQRPASDHPTTPVEPDLDFSLVLGGPLFQLLRRTGLTGNALELARLRTFVGVLLT